MDLNMDNRLPAQNLVRGGNEHMGKKRNKMFGMMTIFAQLSFYHSFACCIFFMSSCGPVNLVCSLILVWEGNHEGVVRQTSPCILPLEKGKQGKKRISNFVQLVKSITLQNAGVLKGSFLGMLHTLEPPVVKIAYQRVHDEVVNNFSARWKSCA